MAVHPKISSIIAAAYDKMGEMSVDIIHNYDNGYGGSQKQIELRARLIKTTKLVRVISKFVEFDDNGNYIQVHRLTDTVINDLLKYLMKVADLDNLPASPKIFYRGHPRIRTEGGPGPKGDTGSTGATGGGTPFSALNFSVDTFVDRFPIINSKSARWEYELYGSLGRRTGTIIAIWSDDGLTISEPSEVGTDDIGITIGNVAFNVEKDGTDIVLKCDITSGTWNIRGTRYFPNMPATLPATGLLINGQIYVGDSLNVAVSRTPSGVVSMTNTGVFSFASGVIVNADINANAAIDHTKMAALTPSRVMVTDGTGFGSASAIPITVLTHIANLNSDAQAQINSKQATITGAATTVVTADLAVNKAVIVNGAGKLAAHASTTDAQIGYLSDVLSPLQAQINNRIQGNLIFSTPTNIGDWNMFSTSFVSIAHGIASGNTKIKGVIVKIYDDFGLSYDLLYQGQGGIRWDASQLILNRIASGFFESTNFDATSFNRGEFIIISEP